MNSVVVRNELQLSYWVGLIRECQTSGMKQTDWLQSKGITKDQSSRYFRQSARSDLSLLRKGSLDVVLTLILNSVSGIAWATLLADWIAFAISTITLSKQQGHNLFQRRLRPYCMCAWRRTFLTGASPESAR